MKDLHDCKHGVIKRTCTTCNTPMTPKSARTPTQIENELKEIAVCTIPDCPHALHKMTVDDYVATMKAKAEGQTTMKSKNLDKRIADLKKKAENCIPNADRIIAKYKSQRTPTPKQELQDLESQYGAAFIVRAVNSHQDLLDAVRALLDMATDNRTHGPEIEIAVKAIARAEGK